MAGQDNSRPRTELTPCKSTCVTARERRRWLIRTDMTVMCAWCGRSISHGDSDSPSSGASHGICPDCRNTFTFQEGVSVQQYIDSISCPIFVVDKEMRGLFGNTKAYEILGNPSEPLTGHLLGEVFECSYSRLVAGCGGTICCSGCTIRHTVNQTFQTGEAQSQVPATIKRNESDASLQITTLMVGEIVLLRIDCFQTARGPE